MSCEVYRVLLVDSSAAEWSPMPWDIVDIIAFNFCFYIFSGSSFIVRSRSYGAIKCIFNAMVK